MLQRTYSKYPNQQLLVKTKNVFYFMEKHTDFSTSPVFKLTLKAAHELLQQWIGSNSVLPTFFLNWLEYWSLTTLFIEYFNKGNYYLTSGYAKPLANSTGATPHSVRRYGFADQDTAGFLLHVPPVFVKAASGSLSALGWGKPRCFHQQWNSLMAPKPCWRQLFLKIQDD